MKGLERELARTKKALAEALALVVLSKKTQGLALGGRGRFHAPAERQRVRTLLEEAVAGGARLTAACAQLGLSARTLQRWRKSWLAEDRRAHVRHLPANRLSEHERQRALRLLHSPEFRGLSPRQFVPRLADQGIYLASESTFYRLLREERRSAHRQSALASPQPPAREQLVTGPNQVWNWDITYFRRPGRGGSCTSTSSWMSSAAASWAGGSIPRRRRSTPPGSSAGPARTMAFIPWGWCCTPTMEAP